MGTKPSTIAILLAVTAGLIGWDVYAYKTGPNGSTISQVILDFSRQHPVIPFAFGILMGHLFWPQTVKKEDE